MLWTATLTMPVTESAKFRILSILLAVSGSTFCFQIVTCDCEPIETFIKSSKRRKVHWWLVEFPNRIHPAPQLLHTVQERFYDALKHAHLVNERFLELSSFARNAFIKYVSILVCNAGYYKNGSACDPCTGNAIKASEGDTTSCVTACDGITQVAANTERTACGWFNSRVFHRHTRLAMLAILPTLCSLIFAVFFFININ